MGELDFYVGSEVMDIDDPEEARKAIEAYRRKAEREARESRRAPIEVKTKALLEYQPRKRRFVLRLYVDEELLETIYWEKNGRANGWPQ